MKTTTKISVDKAKDICLEAYHNSTMLRPITIIRSKPMYVLPEFYKSAGCMSTLDSIVAGRITPYYKHAQRLMLKPKKGGIDENTVIYGNGAFYHIGEGYVPSTSHRRLSNIYAMRLNWKGEIVYICTYKHLLDKNTFLRYIHFNPRDIFLVREDPSIHHTDRKFPNHVFKLREVGEDSKEYRDLIGVLRNAFRPRKRKAKLWHDKFKLGDAKRSPVEKCEGVDP